MPPIALDMPCVIFITHAEVAIDPAVPVPEWPLSPAGRARHLAFNGRPFIKDISALYCSAERKAIDGAEILAEATGLVPVVREALHENDRSATGFLPPPEFEATANQFFAYPQESIRGWERAIDARARVVQAVNRILAEDTSAGHIAIVAHGGVGTLLLCHLTGTPISRDMDQPANGGGNYFAFGRATGSVLHGWRDIGAQAG